MERIAVAKFERGKRHDRVSAKHQPEAEWHDFDFIHPDVDITKLPDPQSSVPRGIKMKKKQDIVSQLCPQMAALGKLRLAVV